MTRLVFLYCGEGTTVRTWLEETRYYTSIHNLRYSETPIIVCFTDQPSLVKARHDYWVRRMTDTKLPPYLVHMSAERDITVWRKDALGPGPENLSVIVPPSKQVEEIKYDISKDFVVIPKFGCRR